MTCKCKGMCGFLFGAFLIVFTFVTWAPAKWVTLAIGILLVLKSLTHGKCCSGEACSTDAVSKKHKTGEELFLTKKKRSNFPSKNEVKEVMTKAKKKPATKKKVVAKKKAVAKKRKR